MQWMNAKTFGKYGANVGEHMIQVVKTTKTLFLELSFIQSMAS